MRLVPALPAARPAFPPPAPPAALPDAAFCVCNREEMGAGSPDSRSRGFREELGQRNAAWGSSGHARGTRGEATSILMA